MLYTTKQQCIFTMSEWNLLEWMNFWLLQNKFTSLFQLPITFDHIVNFIFENSFEHCISMHSFSEDSHAIDTFVFGGDDIGIIDDAGVSMLILIKGSDAITWFLDSGGLVVRGGIGGIVSGGISKLDELEADDWLGYKISNGSSTSSNKQKVGTGALFAL